MTAVFHNRAAAFLWGFAAVFMLFLAAMSHVLLRDGPPPDYPPWLTTVIVAGFWAAGLGLCAYVAGKPCVRVAVQPGTAVLVVWRYPFKTVRREVSCSALHPAKVVESRDDEGNPYFHARLTLPDGASADFAEGHDRRRCEAACARFNAALRLE